MDFFELTDFRIIDAIDIVLVAALLYYLYRLVKGTVAINIFIGIENNLKQLQGCSLITASYRNNQNVLGSIGVVGPTSMDYKRIITMVDYTAKILSKTITEQSYD